ncbi:MAG: tetratricopeptide repeat protein [Treponema sp.]
MRKISLFLVLFIFSLSAYSANHFVAGLDAYARNDWLKAINSFQGAINNAKTEGEIETSLYYLIMSLASSGNYKNAVNSANIFLSRYPKSDKYPDILYQRGRLYCLLGLFEKSIKELYSFIYQYPTHRSLLQAYYWIGEGLYLSGKLQEARDIFSRILLNYPSSSKTELVKQRISLIDQASNQEELLTLLRLNQEQTMKLAKEYEQKQLDYEKAIAEYKDSFANKVDEARLDELERILQEEREKNAELYEKLLVLEAKNKELLEILALLEKPSEEPIVEEPIEEVAEEEKEETPEVDEAAERRRLVLEILKRKARQLEGMYDEILEEEK